MYFDKDRGPWILSSLVCDVLRLTMISDVLVIPKALRAVDTPVVVS